MVRPRPAAPAPASRRRDPLAVAAVALAVVWLFGLGSLAAIVLGYAALRRGSRDRTLARAGIGLGAVGLALAVVFFAINAVPG